ncbi:MAG: hypothetical protein QM817_41840 [Archangium sp.]
MRIAAGLLLCGLAGCQCGPNPAGDDAGVDASVSMMDASVATDAGQGDAGIDAGPPNRVQIYGGGSFAARSCQQITVRAVGRTTVPVSADTVVTLDGGRWVEFFDAMNCNGAPTNTVTLLAGTAQYEFRFRANAFGAMEAEASTATLDSGTMSFTSQADVLFDGTRAVLPSAACFPIPPLKAVIPFSMTEVPAAAPSRFTLITVVPFGGSGTDAGCFNSQFDVTMPEGSSRAELFGGSAASAGSTQNLTLSPVVPAGVVFPTTTQRMALFAQCLPTGEACDGGAACCGGACATGACP